MQYMLLIGVTLNASDSKIRKVIDIITEQIWCLEETTDRMKWLVDKFGQDLVNEVMEKQGTVTQQDIENILKERGKLIQEKVDMKLLESLAGQKKVSAWIEEYGSMDEDWKQKILEELRKEKIDGALNELEEK